MSHPSQFTLLRTRRFLPFFITQLLGAFNDNIFKQSLILAILYKLTIDGDRSIWVNLCALLFILPFFLFSALAGQLGEKFNKDALIRVIKIGEIVIMAVGATGFLTNHLELMLLALFAMGTHSALFGPVKYSIMPQALHEDELVGGNGLVEMGTFLAILAGTDRRGIMMSSTHYAPMVAVAIVGGGGARLPRPAAGIPRAAALDAATAPGLEYLTQSWATLRMGLTDAGGVASRSSATPGSGLSAAIYLTQIPAYAKEWLHGDETVVTLILTVFSVGIALGSMLCENFRGVRSKSAWCRSVHSA